jgi:C1A family cysteine protease
MEKKSAFLLLIPLLLVAYILSESSTSSSFLSTIDLDMADFNKFLQTYNKHYSHSEKKYRLSIFKSNLKLIHEINSQSLDFKLAINKFADLTQEEFSQLQSTPKKTNMSAESRSRRINENQNLKAAPSSFDWRDKGAVSDVIDQGNCMSSWAISAVGAVEGALVAQGLVSLIDLSVQEVLDCANGASDHGCSGGLIDDAFLFVQNYGLTTDLIYPYIAANQTCKQNSVKQNVTIIHSFYEVPSNDSPSLINQVAMTPVVSQVDADNYVWQFYYSGVINKFCGTDSKHYVLIVGYNQDASPPYYIVKNSWGQQWGESGYARIGIYGGAGICGIQQVCSYPSY